jgi:hypothetical protein
MIIWHPCRRSDIVSDTLPDGSTVLYDPRAHRAYAINATAAHIWNECGGTQSIVEIADVLLSIFDVEPDRVAREVASLLQELLTHKLLEPPGAAAS